MSSRRSRRVWAGLRVLGLVVLVAALLRKIEWAAVVASYRGVGAGELLGVALAVLAAMGLRLWKWQVQLRAMDLASAPPRVVARGFLLGVLLGAVTPLRIGEFYRVAAATPGGGEARGRAAAGVLLDKGYELLVVLVTLAAGAVAVGLPLAAGVGAWVLVAALAWLVLGPASSGGGGWRGVAALRAAKRGLGGGDRARLLAATTGAHALNLGAGLVIYRAFGELAVADYLLRIPMITLINTAPITVGGFGLRELTAMHLFGAVAYPAAGAAVAAAALFFAANVLPALLLLPAVAGARSRA